MHKFYNYTVIHISDLLHKRNDALEDLLEPPTNRMPSRYGDNRVLVIDCVTNYAEQSPSLTLKRTDSGGSAPFSPVGDRRGGFPAKMHLECRRRQFGSDMEIMVRAFCAQRGWNAIISRKKRGCLACAIREAGGLGWRVILRVE